MVLTSLSAAAACVLPDQHTGQRPGPAGEPTVITVSIIVADFLGVDDLNQKLDLDLIATYSWHDPRLVGLEGCQFNVSKVWFPPLILINSSHLRTLRTNARNQVSVSKDGNVGYTQRFTGLVSSYHNLQKFPFDHQDFRITFGPFGYGVNEMQLVADNENTWISERLNIEGWQVESAELSSQDIFFRQTGKNVSVLHLVISADRNSDYYIYRVLLLLGFVVAMSWSIFWIPPSRFEFQIGLGATSMLTIIAFNLAIAGNLPTLGYLTILDKILVVAVTLVFLSIVEALLAGLLVLNGKESLAVRIDRISRIAFPALLVLSWAGFILSAR